MVLKLAPSPLPVTERAVLNEANACTSDRPLDTRPLSEERAFAFWQKDIPEAYWGLDGAALAERIAEARRCLLWHDRMDCRAAFNAYLSQGRHRRSRWHDLPHDRHAHAPSVLSAHPSSPDSPG